MFGFSGQLRRRPVYLQHGKIRKGTDFLQIIRTKQSLKCIILNSYGLLLCGILIMLSGTVILVWNESQAVTTAKTLDEGLYSVVSISDTNVIEKNVGKLVHLTGMLTVHSPLLDNTFGIRVKAVQLKRRVQIYQWILEEPVFLTDSVDINGENSSYSQTWKDKLIDSDQFFSPHGHENPKSIPLKSEIHVSDHVQIGDFKLSNGVKNIFTHFHPFSGDEEPPGGKMKLHNGMYFITNDIFHPLVGDLRVQFYYAGHDGELLTIVAKQEEGGLHPYVTSSGREILIIRPGKLSAQEMFSRERSQSQLSLWSYRWLGWFLIFIGATCISSLIHHLMAQHSFFRGLLLLGFGSSNLTLSVILSLLLVGGAWCFYKPTFALGLFLVAALPLFRKILQDNYYNSSDQAQVLLRSKIQNLC